MTPDLAVLELRRQRLLAELADGNERDAARPVLDGLYRQLREVDRDLRQAREVERSKPE